MSETASMDAAATPALPGASLPAAAPTATATATAAAAMPSAAGTPGAGSVAGMIGSLALVIALIFAMAWVARRMQNLRRGIGGLQVLAAVPVGAKEKVVMLKLGDEHFLLGVAAGSVSLLHRYETEPPALAVSNAVPMKLDTSAFAARLRDMMGKQG